MFRQVFVVVGYDGFCFPQRCKPPLNFEIFIPSDAFYNSAFFDQQFEFAWLCVIIVTGLRCEVDAPSRDPIPLYDTLVG